VRAVTIDGPANLEFLNLVGVDIVFLFCRRATAEQGGQEIV
jgi:hypothetical protein